MKTHHDDAALLAEVEPTVARLLDRHVGVAKEWFPHDYIPYSLGRDYDKEPWTPDQPRLTGVAQTAFEVNLLTEDNLPSYHRLIYKIFSKGDGAWKNWAMLHGRHTSGPAAISLASMRFKRRSTPGISRRLCGIWNR